MGERWASGSRYNDTELCPAHPLPSRRTTRRHFLLNPHVDYGPELARARIAERVRDKQHQAWNKAERTGMSFVGPRRVVKLAHTKRAESYEVFGSLNPQFAAAGNRVAATEAVKRLRAFRAQYARALGAWTAGDRSVCFPEGTWWMRLCHGVRCGPGP
jgi:hypothetical protein